MVKELQFDEEELITDESLLESLNLKQNTKDVTTDINSVIFTIPVMMFTTFVESRTCYVTHPCSDALSLLLGDMRSQIGRDWLPLIYQFLAERGEELEV